MRRKANLTRTHSDSSPGPPAGCAGKNAPDYRPRILLVNACDIGGGAEKIALDLLRCYRQDGYDAWLAVGHKRGAAQDTLVIRHRDERRGWSRLWWDVHDRLQSFDGRLRGALRLSRLARKLAEPASILDTHRGLDDFSFPGTARLLRVSPCVPDILHCHNLHGGYFDLRALPALTAQVPTILTAHDEWLLTGGCGYSFGCEGWRTGCTQCPEQTGRRAHSAARAENWQRKREIYAESRFYVTAPSRWLMQKIQHSTLMKGAVGTRVIPNGVNTAVFCPASTASARADLGIPQDAWVLLSAANGVKRSTYKGYQTLRAAVHRLATRIRGQKLLLIGLGENAPPERLGDARVRFVPFQKDPRTVARYYQAADVYVHAASAEAWGLTVTEALACGTPVVATAVGGVPEQVRDGVTGFLVPPSDPEAMAARLAQLLTDDACRKRFGAGGARHARHAFGLDRQGQAYLDLYREMIAERTAAALLGPAGSAAPQKAAAVPSSRAAQPALSGNGPLRALFLPFYEAMPSPRNLSLAGLRQRRQKRGLREALARQGQVVEIDYRRQFRKRGREGLMRAITEAAAALQPNLVLTQLHSADTVEGRDIRLLRERLPDATWANWNGDYRDPATWSAADWELASAFDLQLVVCHDASRAYERRGITAHYWQAAWEPDAEGHQPRRWTRRHDVLFQANCYSNARRGLARAIREAGFDVGLYGVGWPRSWASGSTHYDFRGGCRLSRAAKIVLADNQWPDADGFASDRVFMSLAAGGALLLHQHFKGYEKLGLVDGENFVLWTDTEDLIEKLRFWLNPENEERRRAIAGAGRSLCIERHSFDVRVRELLHMLSKLERAPAQQTGPGASAPSPSAEAAPNCPTTCRPATGEPTGPPTPVGPLPKISVVIPSRDQAGFLARALDSLKAQQYPDLEVIVADGGSRDGTVELLKSRADVVSRWVSEPDRGQTHALNKGFAMATGRVFGWLNCDEAYRPGALALVGRAFAAEPDLDIAFGHRVVVDAEAREVERMKLPAMHPRMYVLYASGLLFSDTTFWTADLHRRTGELDEADCARYAMDFDWFGRLSLNVKRWRRLDAFLSEFTDHPGRVSWGVAQMPQIAHRLRRRLHALAGVGPLRVMAMAPLCFFRVRYGREGWQGLLRPPSPLSLFRLAGLVR